nr:hypothetical protein [Armatimonadota bacterium]
VGSKADPPDTTPARLPRPVLLVWLLVAVGAMVGSLWLGRTAGADFVAARGLLLGLLGGLGLVIVCRRAASPPLVLGLGTALVAAGRLWLTHGEITGLTSLALGVALSVLCLGIAPALRVTEAQESQAAGGTALSLLYVLCLAATVALGFTRAGTLGEAFWADIPLLLGAGLSLGAAVSVSLARRSSPNPLVLALPTLIAALVVVVPLSRLAHSWRPLELLGLGILFFGLFARLFTRSATLSSTDVSLPAFSDALGPLIGLVMIVSGITLAMALWSGYGAGLFVLGGWFAVGPALLNRQSENATSGLAAASGFGFAALFLLHRLATLQNNPAVHANGPGDVWDLLAICLGALLPLLAAEWARLDSRTGALAPWAVVLQWVLTLALPALILDYVWQPRSVAGILLGAALGQLLAGGAGGAEKRFPVLALSGVLLGLVLFQFLPVLGHIDVPTRFVRLALVAAGAGLLILRLLVPTRIVQRTAA